MAKKTATVAELAAAINGELATAEANRQHQAARECIALMRELRPDGMPGDNFQERREFQSAWLSSEIPGLTIDRAKTLAPLELLAMLRLLKERLRTTKGNGARASAADADRWEFARPLREKRPSVGWKEIAHLWTEKTGDPTDESTMRQACHRARKTERHP